MSRDLLFKVEMRSDPTMLCVVRATVERLTEAFGFPAADSRAITRAVDEAMTNIMRHAYQGRSGQPIEMKCQRLRKRSSSGRGEGLEILLVDHGSAVDHAKLRGRCLDDIKPGGLGLHFIRQSMDLVQFKRMRGANLLRLIKYLQVEKQD